MGRTLLDPSWGVLRSKLRGWEIHVGGLGDPLGSISGLVGSKWSLGQEANGKGSGRAWVGPKAAGDSEMGRSNMGPT